MASTVAGFSQAIYNCHVGEYAHEFAIHTNPGHPLLGGFDKERYDADYAEFLRRVDTPEKLMAFAGALNP